MGLCPRKINLYIRDCSYGGGLSRLTGLARLAEISPCFINSLKKKCVHMINEPARLAEISVDLTEISPRRDKNFPYEHISRLTGMWFVIRACAVSLLLLFSKTLEMIDSCFRFRLFFLSRNVNKHSSRLGWMKKFTIWIRGKNYLG